MTIERVLLVDDDDVFRDRLAAALRNRGLAVKTAATPAQAMALAQAWTFDGAVIDLRMPGGSGLNLIGDLHAGWPLARLIVLTGYGSIATALQAVRSGAADYRTKPADADQILAALRGEPAPLEGVTDQPLEVPSLDRMEWEHLQRVLADCGGNISQAARLLGINRRSLQRKLARYPPVR
jgi:two-component system response regulator RegA